MLQILLVFEELLDLPHRYVTELTKELIELLDPTSMCERSSSDIGMGHGLHDLLKRIEHLVAFRQYTVHDLLGFLCHQEVTEVQPILTFG